ncbi:hypothetical protein HFA01_28620 [Halobacillus faecis]|uniref:Uncharacterized protein n=1 Tax=Halobacillus faecis TaxID=360184 RepID=A0A511WTW5_9BACI|nr:hypothetical protein HFA01_28620 [Halobacillus faecis]
MSDAGADALTVVTLIVNAAAMQWSKQGGSDSIVSNAEKRFLSTITIAIDNYTKNKDSSHPNKGNRHFLKTNTVSKGNL